MKMYSSRQISALDATVIIMPVIGVSTIDIGGSKHYRGPLNADVLFQNRCNILATKITRTYTNLGI